MTDIPSVWLDESKKTLIKCKLFEMFVTTQIVSTLLLIVNSKRLFVNGSYMISSDFLHALYAVRDFLKFSIVNSSLMSKVENWLKHWMAISFCLELLSSVHQRSLERTESASLQIGDGLIQPL